MNELLVMARRIGLTDEQVRAQEELVRKAQETPPAPDPQVGSYEAFRAMFGHV